MPLTAAWRHLDAREGFESTRFSPRRSGLVIDGATSAVEDGEVWAVRYTLVIDERWRTRRAIVSGLSAGGTDMVVIDADDTGHWRVDGRAEPDLDGCVDVDLEASACTNTLPIRRLALGVGDEATAPAVYVRATDLAVVRLEQSYRRLESPDESSRYHYRSSTFDFECVLVLDEHDLPVDYPGIATRIA